MGPIYALRRELFVELRGDIISDFVAPLHAWQRGFRIAYEPTARCHRVQQRPLWRRVAPPPPHCLALALRTVDPRAGVLNPFAHFFFAFQMFSHKVLRWLVPVWLLVVLAVNIPLVADGYYGLLLALQVAFYGLAALGLWLPERLGRCWLFLRASLFHRHQLGHLVGAAEFPNGSPPPRLAAGEVERLCRA